MTSKEQLKELVKHIVAEIMAEDKLKEVSGTGGVSAPATKFAFGKVNKRVASQGGMTPVSGPSAEVNEGWAMGQYTPEQTNSLKFLSKAGFREISSFPASPDAHGEGQTDGVVVVVQRKHSKFGTTQCEVEPDGSCNGQTVADFIRSGINEGKKPTNRKFENPAPEVEKPINEPISRGDVDYINKEKKSAVSKKDTKKVKSITKLQQLVKRAAPFYRIDEDTDFHIKTEKDTLETAIKNSEYKLRTEKIKLLKQKLLNKNVTLRGSKGYGQVKRDYTIVIKDINIEDYYGEYQIIFKDDKNKDYFIDTMFKIKILDQKPATPEQPAAQPSTPVETPAEDLSKEIQK